MGPGSGIPRSAGCRVQPRWLQRGAKRGVCRGPNHHARACSPHSQVLRGCERPAGRCPMGYPAQGPLLGRGIESVRSHPPTPEDQVRFLQNVQRLLSEGGFVATYKFALLHALADLSVLKGDDSGAPLQLTTFEIAEQFVEIYWRQVTSLPPGPSWEGVHFKTKHWRSGGRSQPSCKGLKPEADTQSQECGQTEDRGRALLRTSKRWSRINPFGGSKFWVAKKSVSCTITLEKVPP